MRTFVSSENPAGHVTILRLPEDSSIVVKFYDEEHERDITHFVCDLLLVGLQVRQETAAAGSIPSEQVELGSVSLRGASTEDFLLLYAHPPTETVVEVSWEDAAALVGLGVDFQVTSGVAAEAVDVPDDASALDSSEDGDSPAGDSH